MPSSTILPELSAMGVAANRRVTRNKSSYIFLKTMTTRVGLEESHQSDPTQPDPAMAWRGLAW